MSNEHDDIPEIEVLPLDEDEDAFARALEEAMDSVDDEDSSLSPADASGAAGLMPAPSVVLGVTGDGAPDARPVTAPGDVTKIPSEPVNTDIGRVLKGMYTIKKKIGEGGMGNVYLATQSPLDRRVAIKLLKPDATNPEGAHYFLREVQAINMLRHPNIIQIVDYGEDDDGSMFLVMEHLPGKTLQRVIKKEYPLTVKRICEITMQVLSALQAAHEKEIVHCDLKPANIMIERVAGQDDFIKVLDFGIAKVKGPTMEVGPYTQAGNIVGTFDYMSPEQIMRKDLDGRADLWSMGVIMYEMLTRKRLFHDKDAVSIIGRVMQMPIVSPQELLGQDKVPFELDRIVMTALERKKSKRFESAEHMREIIRRFARGVGTGAHNAVGDPRAGDTSPSGITSSSFSQSGSYSGVNTSPTGRTGWLRRTADSDTGPSSGPSPSTASAGRAGKFPQGALATRSGAFASVDVSSRLQTGIAQGTSVLDQTFGLEALQESLTGERRTIAVLAIQQRARTQGGVDPEELARRSAKEARVIKEVVAQFEGEIDSFLGGTYTILFGARRARVGDNLRVVECALALKERLSLLEHGSAHLGIGLAHGEVYLAARQGGSAFGAPIDRAVEIARGTQGAQVMVDENLSALTAQRVRYDVPQRVGAETVSQVLGVKSQADAQGTSDAALRNVNVFIPRPTYVNELVQRSNAVESKQGGGVALVGQVGVGKTVLLERFVANRAERGWQVFSIAPAELVDAQALAPVRLWIQKIARTYENPAVLIQKACASMGLRSNVQEVIKLYVGTDPSAVVQAELPWRDQQGYIHFTAALFHRLLRFAMKKAPVLLTLEELDTTDSTLMDFIDSVIKRIQTQPVLLVTTKRIDSDIYNHGLPNHFEVMPVEGLLPAETLQYVSQLVGYTPSPHIVSQLHERASGNPMFLKEILRALLKQGSLEDVGQDITQAGIPQNLKALLAQRLDELPEGLRDLLAIASVMGESFREGFFYQVSPSHLEPQTGLQDLVEINMFEAREDALGRMVVGFVPRSLRRVVYDRLPIASRERIHQTIIEFLESAPHVAEVDELDVPLMLAFHHRSIKEPLKASEYTYQVGRLLLDRYDYDGAIAHFKESLELAQGAQPDDPLRLKPMLQLLTTYREAGRLSDAQALAQSVPSREQLPQQLRAEFLLEVGLVGMETGQIDHSMTALFGVIELAQARDDAKLEVQGLLALAQLFEKENQLPRAANILAQVAQKVGTIGDLDLARPKDRRLTWTAYNQLGALMIRQQDIPNAQVYLQKALEQAHSIQDHRGMVRVYSNMGALFLTIRDMNQASAFFQKASELARDTGDLLNQSRILINMGIVSFEVNDLEFSQKHFKAARRIAEEIGWYEGLAELSQHIKRLRKSLGR